MNAEVYFALKPEEQIITDTRKIGELLPPESIHRPNVGCLGEVKVRPYYLKGIHISILIGRVAIPGSIKDFNRRMENAIRTIVPRRTYQLHPEVSTIKKELILVPNDEGCRVLRRSRQDLIGLLDIETEDKEYLPHATLGGLNSTADVDLITKRMLGLSVLFKTLTVHVCIRGVTKHPIINTLRPGPRLRR